MFTAWRHRLTAGSTRRRFVFAGVAGVLSAFALPPWHVVPVLVPAFIVLMWLIDAAAVMPRARTVTFGLGFAFGFGQFAVAFHWIASPLLVDAAATGWLIPFAVVGLAAALAVFTAVTALVYAIAVRRGWTSGAARILVFAVLWTAVEWLRGWLFTGFPWNLMGHVWSASPAMLQATAITGIFGLTLLTVAAAAMPAILADPDPGIGRRRALVVVLTLILPAIVWSAGAARLAAAPAGTLPMVPDVRLRIVQPNIAQRNKWQPELRADNLRAQVALSTSPPVGAPPTHVIWSETAVPFFLDSTPDVRDFAALAVPAGGLLITGAPRRVDTTDGPKFWNSVHAVDSRGVIAATYDKSHLVPFGEYVPARGILPIDRIVPSQGDFTPGPGRRTLRLQGLPPVSPLVCYEAIFAGRVVDRADRPDWLLNLTNDAWFGNFAGPRQHFAIARIRAVEEGLPMVRAAGTGISAVIGPYGRRLASLPLGQAGILDADLPTPLRPTLYARFGNLVLAAVLALTLAFSLVLRVARPTQSR